MRAADRLPSRAIFIDFITDTFRRNAGGAQKSHDARSPIMVRIFAASSRHRRRFGSSRRTLVG